MSSYLDTEPRLYGGSDEHDWRYFTERRLVFLYGPNHRAERAAMTTVDVEAWNRLGQIHTPAHDLPQQSATIHRLTARTMGDSVP
jgi:hypothetical protein